MLHHFDRTNQGGIIMKAFKRFYIWGMDTKRDMGVYLSLIHI